MDFNISDLPFQLDAMSYSSLYGYRLHNITQMVRRIDHNIFQLR